MPDLTGKTIVITGANSGIGKVCTQALASQGARVLMVCRSQSRGEAARQDIWQHLPQAQLDLHLCDMASQASIRACGLALRDQYDHIDVLLNNAGAMFGERQLTEDGFERTFAVDHLGYVLFTHYLLDLVQAGSIKRIVNVSSEAHRFVKDIDWDNLQAEKKFSELGSYSLAKLGNVYFTRELARQLQPQGITVNCLHPGFVDTQFGSDGSFWVKLLMPVMKLMAVSPEKGAETSLFLVRSDQVATVTGAYFKDQRKTPPSALAQKEDLAQRFWDLSLTFTGLTTYGHVSPTQS
jgi:NAD(P)-dependent dehydrogenase (short-subunit alcohol dehydrogenase family)